MDNQTPDKEHFSIHCWGFKIDADNPGKRTILILALLLVFFLVLAWLLKAYCLPLLAVSNGRNSMLGLIRKVFARGK